MGLDLAVYKKEILGEIYITHNLAKMAKEAGVYYPLWRINEYSNPKDAIGELKRGLVRLTEDPTKFKDFEPSNGWGTLDDLIEAVEWMLNKLNTSNVEISVCS